MDEDLIQNVAQELSKAQRVLVVSHIRPDGDAVGSLLGLGLALTASGREVQMVLADGVPQNYRHLPGSEKVQQKPQGEFDLVFLVDCSDMKRLGGLLNGNTQPDVNIDHHITNDNFARFNLVDPMAVATAELLAKYLPLWDLPITQPVATALLNGIVSDTLGFRTNNMNPTVLRVAADLMDKNVDLIKIFHHALLSHSYEAARYWGAGLSKLQKKGRLAWTTLTLEDRKMSGYSGRDDADLINILSTLDETDVVIIFLEQSLVRTKVSWRAKLGFDVAKIATSFGGGGHPAAAGAEIPGGLTIVQQKVLEATKALFVT